MRKLLPGWVRGFICLWLVGSSFLMYAGNPLSGSYTINSANPASSTNFTSFQMAADSLMTNGVSGAVTVNVAAGSYVEYMSLGYVSGASSTNTITFDGGDTATTSISNDGTVQNATIKVDSVQWLTITNLKVINTKTIDDAWGVQIMNESDYCTISNCVFEMAVLAAFEDNACIVANGSETASSTEGIFGDNLTINNNVFRNGYYGIRLETSLSNDSNVSITSNHFNGNIGYGCYSDNLRVVTLTGNTADGASLTSKDGFYFLDVVDFDIQNNIANVPDYGLYMSDANFDDVPTNRGKIINNMFNGTGDEGVYLDDVETLDFFHNTVRGAGSTSAYAIRVNDLVDVVFKNNIFYSEQSYAFYSVDDLNGSTSVDIDYNLYYTGGATLAYISSSNLYTDLAAWQAADTTSNVNSVSGDPIFANTMDLHVSGLTPNDVGDNSVGVTTDIDGDSRPISGSTVVDMGADEFTPPSCSQPVALGATATSSSTADLFWTTGGASNWNVEYGVAGFTQGSGTYLTASNDTISLTGLMGNTTYQFYVRDSCSASDLSSWSGPSSFTTPCAPLMAPFTESFDATTAPSCWNLSATSGGPWVFSGTTNSSFCTAAADHTGNAGSFAWMDQSSTDASVILQMPDADVSGLTTPYLDFYYWMCGVGYTPFNQTIIESWNGSSWNVVDSLDVATAGWENFGYDLSGHTYGANLVRIRFRAESGGSGSDFYGDNALDDVGIIEAPTCPDPSNLGAFNIGETTTDIYWTGGGSASNWTVEYGAAGFTPGTGSIATASNDTTTLMGLTGNTAYDFYVTDSCGAGDLSNQVGPFSFTTITLCPAIESLPFYENFDVSAGCFDTIDGGAATGDSWVHTINSSQNLDGTGYVRVDSDANGNAVQMTEGLESPIIDASSLSNNLVLEFDHYYRDVFGTDNGTVEVYDGTAWVSVAVYNSSTGAWSSPTHEEIDVTAYANANFQVRFTYDDGNNWAWYWSIDNFSVVDRCVKQSLPYVENFDVDQGCFDTIDGGAATGDSWAHSTDPLNNLDGTGYMRVDSDLNGNAIHMIETMESPAIDASTLAGGNLLLDFDHYYRDVFGSDSGAVEVYDGTSWINVASFGSTLGAWGAPDHQTIDITAYANADLKVRFRYDDGDSWAWYWSVDNISIAEVGCLTPSALGATNITSSSADVYWTTGGATNWNIEYDTTGFAPGTGNVVAATNDTTTLSGLMPNTTYDFYVQDSCSATSVSTWVGPFSFTTACVAFVAPYTESFDGTSLPACWAESAITGGPWLFSGSANSVQCAAPTDNTGNGGNYAWMDQSGGDATVVLEMPNVDVSALTIPYLDFYYWMCAVGYSPSNLTILETWDGAAWINLDTLDQGTTGWENMGYDLTGRTYGSNLVKVRFIAESGGSSDDFWGDNSLDDVSIIEKPSCPDPSALGATNIGTTSADIYWTPGGAMNWNVEYGVAGFTPGTGTLIAATNDTISLTSLMQGTLYEFYVQDSCGAGDLSTWVGPASFATIILCPAVETIPFYENFDISEGCFDTIDGGGATGDSWVHTVNATQNLDGTGYMRVDSDVNGNGILLDETLESPIIDASTVNNSLILEFDHYYRAIGPDTGRVEVYDGANWVEVAKYGTNTGAFGAPAREVLDVSAYANASFQVRFNYNDGNTWAWYWSVDNFSVEDKCITQTLPYVENFDASAGCFSSLDSGGATGDSWTHTVSAAQNLDGTGYMRVDSDLNGNGVHLIETMVSPTIDASTITGTLMLEFDHYYRTVGGDSGTVDVWDGSAWINLATFTADVGAWGVPDQQAIDITAYANANLQVRFHYDDNNSWSWYWSVDNFSVMEVGCVAPSALGVDTATQTTADIFWTSGGASNWNVEYGPVGFTPGTGTLIAATNDTIQIGGLTSSSCYDFYVQDSCGAGDVSTFTGPFTFCTLCGPFTAPFYESFDGTGIPNCWTTFNQNGATTGNSIWRNTSAAWPAYGAAGVADHTGNAGFAMGVDGSSAGATDTAVVFETPEIDMSPLTSPELVYWVFQNNISTPDNMIMSIDLYDGTNWIDSISGYSANSATWVEVRLDLSSYTFSGNAKIRFRVDKVAGGVEPFRSDIIIDDVSIDEKPACIDPSNPVVAGQTTTSIDWTWTSDANIIVSKVEYEVTGFVQGTGILVNTTPGSVSISGLMPGTCYDFYIQDSCSSLTNWIGPFTACTQAVCSVTTTPTLTGDTAICGGGPITLTGTPGSGDIAWMLNGIVYGTGTSYNDSIGGTTVYEGADYSVVGPAVHVGPLSTIATTGFGNFTNGQWFTVLDTISIDSTTVTANGFVEGRVVISDDAGGNIIQLGETFQTGTTAGDYQVPIGVILTPGNYFMNVEFDATTTGQLFRATGGAVFPYVLPGLMTVDSVNFAGARYYYTFDLVVSGACLGTAVPVTGFVPGPNSGTSDTVSVCEGNTAVNLASFLGSYDAGGVWIDVDTTGAIVDSILDASITDTGAYYNFTYALPSSGGCIGDSATITVFVDFQPNAGMDAFDTLCTNDNSLLALNPYLGTHSGGGSWTDLDTSGALLGNRVRPSNAAPGTYRYQYSIASNGACPSSSAIVTITVEDPVTAGAGGSDTICDSIGAIDLSAYLDASAFAGGNWVDLDASGALNGSSFDASVAGAGTYNFGYAVLSAGCGDDTAVFTIYVQDCSIGLNEQIARTLDVYPNPTSGSFFVEAKGAVSKDMYVEIYALNGQLLYGKSFDGYNAKVQLDISDFARGVYNVKIRTEKGVEVHRITRQ